MSTACTTLSLIRARTVLRVTLFRYHLSEEEYNKLHSDFIRKKKRNAGIGSLTGTSRNLSGYANLPGAYDPTCLKF